MFPEIIKKVVLSPDLSFRSGDKVIHPSEYDPADETINGSPDKSYKAPDRRNGIAPVNPAYEYRPGLSAVEKHDPPGDEEKPQAEEKPRCQPQRPDIESTRHDALLSM